MLAFCSHDKKLELLLNLDAFGLRCMTTLFRLMQIDGGMNEFDLEDLK
jgi:hypothetical protein